MHVLVGISAHRRYKDPNDLEYVVPLAGCISPALELVRRSRWMRSPRIACRGSDNRGFLTLFPLSWVYPIRGIGLVSSPILSIWSTLDGRRSFGAGFL